MKRVLVTGGASGLGLALVNAFVARGDQVLATDLAPDTERAPDALPSGAAYLTLDVRLDEDWAHARDWVTDHWGGLDILVNNAGIAQGGRIDRVTLDDWRLITDVNLLGVVRGCHVFTPVFKKQGSGHIVNVASMAGLVHPPAMASYNAVKAGVVALSETLQHELAPYGVTTSVVCPSFFRTNLAASFNTSDPMMAGFGSDMVNNAKVDAEHIAAIVMAGVDKGRHLILTDREGRRAYWSKRYARGLYDRQLAKYGLRTARPDLEGGQS